MIVELAVRSATAGDATRIADLMAQLGYEVGEAAVAEHIGRFDENRDILVALADEKIVGCTSVSGREDLMGPRATIEHFVVDEALRSLGVGARLLAAAEEWARERGYAEVRLHSNVIRERAHTFYERHGYSKVKAQYQLSKSLRE